MRVKFETETAGIFIRNCSDENANICFSSGSGGGGTRPGPQIWGPRLYSEARITHILGGPELGPPGQILDPLLCLIVILKRVKIKVSLWEFEKSQFQLILH